MARSPRAAAVATTVAVVLATAVVHHAQALLEHGAVATNATLRYPLASRCLNLLVAEPCFVAPIGAVDRFIKSRGNMEVHFQVGCGYTVPDTAVLAVRDLHNGGNQAVLDPTGPGFTLYSTVLVMNGPEPGTHVLNVTLVDVATGQDVDWMAVCLDFTPDPQSVRVTPPVEQPLSVAPAGWPSHLPRVVIAGEPPAQARTTKTVAAAPPPRPIRALWLGDTHSFDGMKQFILATVKHAPRRLLLPHYLDLACSPPGGVMEGLLADAGVPTGQHCVQCPAEVCHHSADAFFNFTATLPSYTAVSQMPVEWQAVLGPVVAALAPYDVVIQVNDRPPDYYVAHLARLANPHMAVVADVTSRFRLHHPPGGPAPPFDAVLAPSSYVATHPAVTANRLPTFVTPGSVDPTLFNPDAVTPLDTCNKATWVTSAGPTTGAVFGFVARVSPEKALGLMFAAAARVIAANPTVRFVVVGHSKRKAYIDTIWRIAELYNLASHVRVSVPTARGVRRSDHCGAADGRYLVFQMVVHTFVSPGNIPRLFKCMDVFVAPYVRAATETFALVNVEAMAMRVPFVHFGTGGIQDYAMHMNNSVLVDEHTPQALAHAMLMLADDPQLRQRLGDNGHRHVSQHYTRDAAGNNTATILRRIVAAKLLDGCFALSVVPRTVATPADMARCQPRSMPHAPTDASAADADASHLQLFGCGTLHNATAAGFDLGAAVGVSRDATLVELIVDLVPTAVPIGFPDLMGLVGLELRRAAVELFLERHGRRSVVCVADVAAPQSPPACSPDVVSLVTHPEPAWDAPPVDLPERRAAVGAGHAPLRGRLRLGVRVATATEPLTLTAWVQDRWNASHIVARTQ